MVRRKKLTCVDLFAGCGGLSLGLEEAGFAPLLFSELNRDAAATYRLNRSGKRIVEFGGIADLLESGIIDGLRRDFSMAGVERVDLVCGGPPCQGYSGIGHRRSYKVERNEIPSNHLYRDMITAIRRFNPRMFLFENVRGLLNGRWTEDGSAGEIWKDVRGEFEGIENYRVAHAVVQAKNYGVPQNRPRVLLVGIHDDLAWTPDEAADAVARGLLPKPIEDAPPHLVDVFEDLVDPKYMTTLSTRVYPRAARGQFQEEMRRVGKRILGKGEEVTEQDYSNHSPKIREKFAYMIEHGGAITPEMQTKKFAQRLLPRKWGPEGPTITATSLPDDFVHYSQPRAPTVREWARLQCFPDWYQFSGKRTTGGVRRAGNPDEGNWDREVPKYTQIGNAVPVRLAKEVGLHLADILKHA